MRTYIRKWPHIRWLLTVANDGTNSIFKALRENTDGAQDMFLSELVWIMEKYPCGRRNPGAPGTSSYCP